MGKTIKQIAEELGVSKQAVHQKRKSKELSTRLQSFTSIVDGVVYISVDGENIIKQAFSKNNRKLVDDNLSSTVDGVVDGKKNLNEVEFLRKQVEQLQCELEREREHNREKDKQLLATLAKLADTQSALATGQAAQKQSELADKLIEGKQIINSPEKKKKSWWIWGNK